jgi:hypothetical protein
VRGQITTTKTEETRRVLLPRWVCSIVNTLPSRFKKREIFLNGYGEPYMRAAHLTEYFEKAGDTTGVVAVSQIIRGVTHTHQSG